MATKELTPEQWKQVEIERENWFKIGTCTEPSDRVAAEEAVSELYRLVGKPKPKFIWFDGPLSACKYGSAFIAGDRIGNEISQRIINSSKDNLPPSPADSPVPNDLTVQTFGALLHKTFESIIESGIELCKETSQELHADHLKLSYALDSYDRAERISNPGAVSLTNRLGYIVSAIANEITKHLKYESLSGSKFEINKLTKEFRDHVSADVRKQMGASPQRSLVWWHGQSSGRNLWEKLHDLYSPLYAQMFSSLEKEVQDELHSNNIDSIIANEINDSKEKLHTKLHDIVSGHLGNYVVDKLFKSHDAVSGLVNNLANERLNGWFVNCVIENVIANVIANEIPDEASESFHSQFNDEKDTLRKSIFEQIDIAELPERTSEQLLQADLELILPTIADALANMLQNIIAESAQHAQSIWSSRIWGAEYGWWIAWYTVARDICGVEYTPEQNHLLDIWAKLAKSSGWWFPLENYCLMCERHQSVKFENRVLHSPDAPAIECRDGFKVYSWRGTAVPAEWIENKDTLDPSIALTWENVEQRRAAAEIIGWARIIEQLEPVVIDVDIDPMVGELLEVDLPDAPKSRFLKVICGTGRTFVLSVPDTVNTALEAQALMWQVSPDEYRELKMRT